MTSTLVRGTREGLCKEVALRCGLKDKKMPALRRGTQVEKISQAEGKADARYSQPQAICTIVAETSYLKTKLCFIVHDLCKIQGMLMYTTRCTFKNV